MTAWILIGVVTFGTSPTSSNTLSIVVRSYEKLTKCMDEAHALNQKQEELESSKRGPYHSFGCIKTKVNQAPEYK